MVHLCVPVLKRYDLLKNMLESAAKGTMPPTSVTILDNGDNWHKMIEATAPISHIYREFFTPEDPMGVAESWNWFLRNVPEPRLIVNDDIIFAPHSIKAIVETPGLLVSALAGTNAFSCFLIGDECVKKVGQFDEEISPGYAYFEDVDYAWRMEKVGIPITAVECGVVHLGSQTLVVNTTEENNDHNRKFMIAQTNFEKKWGRLPADRVRQTYGEKA